MRQPKVSFWLGLLLPMLEQAQGLARAVSGQRRLLLDGTERPVTRSTDYETQKEHYSGKKNDTR